MIKILPLRAGPLSNEDIPILLRQGKKELEEVLGSISRQSDEPILVSTKAFGYLLREGAFNVLENEPLPEGNYQHVLTRRRDIRQYYCITGRKV